MVYLLLREEKWEFPPKGRPEGEVVLGTGWRGWCHGHACHTAGQGWWKPPKGVTRAELCWKWAGAVGKVGSGFIKPSFHLCKEQFKTTPGKLNFYLFLKIWSVYVSFNAHMQFTLWGCTMKQFGPKLYPSHAQFSSMVALQKWLQINASVAKSRIWSFIASNETRIREFRHWWAIFSPSSHTNMEDEGSCL